MFDVNKLDEIIIGGIDPRDCPDFCDAYLETATYNGVLLTYEQLDKLNEQESSFVNEYALLTAWGS